MKFFTTTLFLILFTSASGQNAAEYAVQTRAEITTDPPSIAIHWVPSSTATGYLIYRKDKEEVGWGNALELVPADLPLFVDLDVEVGRSYEYRVEKRGGNQAIGYINAAIEAPVQHSKGFILLVVDSSFKTSLAPELAVFSDDLISEGWVPRMLFVGRDESPSEVKSKMADLYENLPYEAAVLIGHVPVPYSGNTNPDGHGDHVGAWPADGYYGDMNGFWADAVVNNTSAAQERNRNVPGDGKFDASVFPSTLEVQIGRIDFANLPAFAKSEEELLRQYFVKNHRYRSGGSTIVRRAVIDDNFGGFNGEAFASSAWKSFAPMLHADSIRSGDYRSTLDTAAYMWSYGCGGGSYTSCSGVGNTGQFAGDSLRSIFTCLFGSYFGDWDSNNNLLRAALAQGDVLTNAWSGRPHWYFHHMALGENIGYSARISMNYTGNLYQTPLAFLGRSVTMGLMGDPSLRMFRQQPVKDLNVEFDGLHGLLTWSATEDTTVLGYYIYRSEEASGPFVLLNEEMVTDLFYSDLCIAASGDYHYMVRAVYLQSSPSGTFFDLSPGVRGTMRADVTNTSADFNAEIMDGQVSMSNTSVNAYYYLWLFGDGETSTEFEPSHTYTQSGDYTITLIAGGDCFRDTIEKVVTITLSSLLETSASRLIAYPNPARDLLSIQGLTEGNHWAVRAYDVLGRQQSIGDLMLTDQGFMLDVRHLKPGVYVLDIIHKTQKVKHSLSFLIE